MSGPSYTEKDAERQSRNRQQRKARRVLDDEGNLVAPLPPEKHGHPYVYQAWSCRCTPCKEAMSYRQFKNRLSRAQKLIAQAQAKEAQP